MTTKKIPIKVAEIQAIKAHLSALSKMVSSSGRLFKDEKIAFHTRIRDSRQIVDDWLQLELFSSAQLGIQPMQRQPPHGAQATLTPTTLTNVK